MSFEWCGECETPDACEKNDGCLENTKSAREILKLRSALGVLASAAAGVLQTNDIGNEADFLPLRNAYGAAIRLLKPL